MRGHDVWYGIAGIVLGAVIATFAWPRHSHASGTLPPPAIAPAAPPQQTGAIEAPLVPPTSPPPRSERTRSYAVLDALWTTQQLFERAPKHAWPERGTITPPPHRRVPRTKAPPLDDPFRGSIRRVDGLGGRKVVALTFDLCELSDNVTGYDADIVNTLRMNDAPATFFAGGKWMRSHKEQAMQLMADPRFEVGTHTWTHGNLHELRGKEMQQQIQWGITEYETLRERLAKRAQRAGVAADAIAQIPARPRLFRFPYGACSPDSLDAVNDAGLYAIQWDVVSGDAERYATRNLVALRVLTEVRPGSIVVFHGNRAGHGTAHALPIIIEQLRNEGYELVTVSELLEMGQPETVKECYALTPGDTLVYDDLVGEGFLRWHHPK